MDLTINNEITKNNITNDEISDFMQELKNALEKSNSNVPNLYSEVFNEIPLASKYKSELNSIIDECLEEQSYEKEFFYFDYDKNGKSYYLDHYYDGNIDRTILSKQEAKGTKYKVGMFYAEYDENYLVEAGDLKDGIKIDVESKLDLLDFEKNKK